MGIYSEHLSKIRGLRNEGPSKMTKAVQKKIPETKVHMVVGKANAGRRSQRWLHKSPRPQKAIKS